MAGLSKKPLYFIGSAKKDLQNMPDEVQDVFGSALLDAQYGDHPDKDLIQARLKAAEDHYRRNYGKTD